MGTIKESDDPGEVAGSSEKPVFIVGGDARRWPRPPELVKANYVVRSSARGTAVQDAYSVDDALHEYLRAQGCRDEEIVRLRPNAVAWRGAVFTASPVAGDNWREHPERGRGSKRPSGKSSRPGRRSRTT
jgi:hypothetical protein